jgi:nicotinamidase-related amidase
MKDKILIVVDMQNDFVTGVLGSKEAQAIIPAIQDKITQYDDEDCPVIYTRDTHQKNYLETHEGKYLPVEHCIENSAGWQIVPALVDQMSMLVNQVTFINKPTFGYTDWVAVLPPYVSQIELCGVCTDICVISNALILRALYPEIEIVVDASCCAGVTPEKHKAALEVMKSCQISVINE